MTYSFIIFSIIILYTTIFLNCDTKNIRNSGGEVEKDSTIIPSDTIIDYFPSKPPHIKKHPDNNLPDSLGGKSVKGFAVIRAQMDARGKIIIFKIVKFKLQDERDHILIDYLDLSKKNTIKYPENISKYKSWISRYVESIEFEINENSKFEDINSIIFMIQFNKQK